MQPPPLPWSEILLELAGVVLGRMPAYAGRVRFTVACRRWHAAEREFPPPLLLLLALPDGTVYSSPRRKPLRLPAAAGYVTTYCNWLLFSGTKGNSYFLRNPLSKAMVPLPALHRVRHLYKQSNGFIYTHETNDALMSHAVRRLLLYSTHLVIAYTALEVQGCPGSSGDSRGGILWITVSWLGPVPGGRFACMA
ncbi:unnamed protein product [Urochloa humidicola]